MKVLIQRIKKELRRRQLQDEPAPATVYECQGVVDRPPPPPGACSATRS